MQLVLVYAFRYKGIHTLKTSRKEIEMASYFLLDLNVWKEKNREERIHMERKLVVFSFLGVLNEGKGKESRKKVLYVFCPLLGTNGRKKKCEL